MKKKKKKVFFYTYMLYVGHNTKDGLSEGQGRQEDRTPSHSTYVYDTVYTRRKWSLYFYFYFYCFFTLPFVNFALLFSPPF